MNILVNILITIFGVSVFSSIALTTWAIKVNAPATAAVGLVSLAVLSMISCVWLYITTKLVFKTFDSALSTVNDIKTGLVEAQELIRNIEECSCTDILHD